MQALNKKEVRTRSLNFWVQFGILVFGMLFVVYFLCLVIGTGKQTIYCQTAAIQAN